VKKVGEGMSVEPSYRVVVQILGRGEEKQPWRVFVEEGIAAKAMGLVEREREREGEEGIVWKKCMQRRCDSGWRSSVGGNCENLCNLERPQAETDEACHD
jgi:hypothetical protein